MSDRYKIEFTEGGVGAFETILTGGLAVVVEKGLDAISGDDNHGWNCTITDKVTGVKETRWGATKAEAQEKTFYALKREIENYQEEQQKEQKEAAYQQNLSQRIQQASRVTSATDADVQTWIFKLVAYLAVGAAILFAILWLVSMVVILSLINIATIALIAGLTKKDWSKFLFLVSILGAILIVFDYNYGWSTKSLVNNASFLSGLVPVFYYMNITAGLVAAYFLIRDYLNEKKPQVENEGEFSKRNLIVIGCLFLVGGLTVGLQKYFDSHTPYKNQSAIFVNPTTIPTSPNTETDDWEGGDGGIENAVGQAPFYIINVFATQSESEAKQKVKELNDKGSEAGYLWIPDYASLSGAKYFSVYLGPFITQLDCEVATEEYRKVYPNAYGVLVSQDNIRVQINGIGKVQVTNSAITTGADNSISVPVDNLFKAWTELNLNLYMDQWDPAAVQYSKKFNPRNYQDILTRRRSLFGRLQSVSVLNYNITDIKEQGNNQSSLIVKYSMIFYFKNGKKINESNITEKYILKYDNLKKRWVILENFDYID